MGRLWTFDNDAEGWFSIYTGSIWDAANGHTANGCIVHGVYTELSLMQYDFPVGGEIEASDFSLWYNAAPNPPQSATVNVDVSFVFTDSSDSTHRILDAFNFSSGASGWTRFSDTIVSPPGEKIKTVVFVMYAAVPNLIYSFSVDDFVLGAVRTAKLAWGTNDLAYSKEIII